MSQSLGKRFGWMEMLQIINKLHVLDLIKFLTIPYLYHFYTGIYLIKLTGVNLLSSNLLVTFVTEIKYLLPRDLKIFEGKYPY